MKNNQSNIDPSVENAEELKSLENDAVWSLLDEATSVEASSMFAQKVMHEVRSVSNDECKSSSWLSKLVIPFGVIGAAGIAASVVMMLSTPEPTDSGSVDIADMGLIYEGDPTSFDENMFLSSNEDESTDDADQFAEELNAIDNADPIFLSADDIAQLVTM